jgi:hypothetical protein
MWEPDRTISVAMVTVSRCGSQTEQSVLLWLQ